MKGWIKEDTEICIQIIVIIGIFIIISWLLWTWKFRKRNNKKKIKKKKKYRDSESETEEERKDQEQETLEIEKEDEDIERRYKKFKEQKNKSSKKRIIPFPRDIYELNNQNLVIEKLRTIYRDMGTSKDYRECSYEELQKAVYKMMNQKYLWWDNIESTYEYIYQGYKMNYSPSKMIENTKAIVISIKENEESYMSLTSIFDEYRKNFQKRKNIKQFKKRNKKEIQRKNLKRNWKKNIKINWKKWATIILVNIFYLFIIIFLIFFNNKS